MARGRRVTISLCVLLLAFSSNALATQQLTRGIEVEGRVVDQNGAPVTEAEVVVSAPSFIASSKTDLSGRFRFDGLPRTQVELTITAPGFARWLRKINALEEPSPLRVVLEPAAISEHVTIAATRTPTRISETAASVVAVGAEDLKSTAAATLDDALRQVPGFSLFRRSGSRTANPTTQGISLRGLGASGASRAVVLADSIPLNDPFGGWVYWNRVPRESISQVEILRGGASHLYGSGALGGVVNISTNSINTNSVSFTAAYGNETASNASLFLGGKKRVSSSQFDDDQNLFRLGSYFTLDAQASRRISRSLDVFLAAENLFNQRYEVGKTPVTTLGPPILVRAGLRVHLGSK